MKRSLLVGLFLIGFAMVSIATTCVPVQISCNGTETYGAACGETTSEIIADAEELAEVFCGD